MANSDSQAETPPAAPAIHVAPSPHLSTTSMTTRRMMIDVLIGLAPAILMALAVFGWQTVNQVGVCVLACVAAEAVFSVMRGKQIPTGDYSAAVTGVILGLSLPANAPLYIAVIGSLTAIGLGKVVFGGLGYNIFNPAMVGRAFVMLSFAKVMGSGAYAKVVPNLELLTQATPLSHPAEAPWAGGFWPLFLGNVNGSLGEISAVALLLGGAYLCVRRVASWEIPVGTLAAAYVCGLAASLAGMPKMTMPAYYHLVSGASLFGAFFIATDPVTSPLSGKGKFIFGLGVGALVMLIRVFSGYPEGMMFAVLLMNAAVPLINRWTIPRPLGGPAPKKDE